MKFGTALRLGRVSNVPTVWTNVLAGIALAGVSPEPRLAVLLSLAISALYVGGMYLNDAFDRDYDRAHRPERPIARGEVRASTVFALGFGLLGLGTALVALATLAERGVLPTLGALALCGLIVLYDAYHKQNPLSPVLMALTRVLVYVTAALGAGLGEAERLSWGCVALLCYLVGLTYAAKQENLLEPRGMWPLLLLQLPFASYALRFADPPTLVLFALLFAWVAYCQVFLLHPRKRNIKRAIGYMIAGISLLDAMIVGSQGQLLGAGLCVAGFLATLLAQRYVPGT